MIITIDVGNTNITVGVFNGDEIVASFRMTTKMPRTSDEYGMLLTNLLEQNRIHCDEIQDAIIASVVPNVMHSLEGAVIKYLNIRPIVIEPGTKTGIRIVTENPRQIGADRIVDAAAAYEIYGGPVLVLDFGTATTYDLVDATGAFVSGVTAPGIRISAKALWEDAAKLPEIEIKKPDSILAKETITSMQAGLVYGQIGQTEYIVRHMKEEANLGEIKVAAENREKNLYAIQFHPEVLHTEEGSKMLHNFVRGVCGCAGTWRMDSFVESTIKDIREKVGDGKVLLALSGGVDSSVAAGLLSRAIENSSPAYSLTTV